MTREEIEQLYVEEPNCFETDREEQWHKVGLKEGLAAADSHPQWIPVEEELPELSIDDWRSENVFFATDDGKSHFGFYSNKGVWFSSVYGFNGHQVTHWMPLPMPPQGKEDKE